MARAARAVGKRYTSIRSPLSFLWSTERRVHAVALAALAVGLAYLGWRISSTLLGAPLWLSLSLLAVEIAGFGQLALVTRTAWRLPDEAPPTTGSHAGVVVLAKGRSEEELERTMLGVERMRGSSGVAIAADDIAAAIAGLDDDLIVVLTAGQVPQADLIDRAAACLGPRDGAVALGSELANPDSLDWAVTGADEHAVENEVQNPGRSARGEAILPAGGLLARRAAMDDAAGAAGGLAQTTALWRAGWDTKHSAAPSVRELGAETLAEYVGQARRDALNGLRAAREVPRRGLSWGQRLTLAGAILPSTAGARIAVVIGVAITSLLAGRLPIAAPPGELAVATGSAFAACGAGHLALGRGRAAAGDRIRRSLRTMGSSLGALAGVVARRTTIGDPRRPAAGLVAALLALDAALLARGTSAFFDFGLPSFGTRAGAAVAVVAALVLVALALDVLQLLVRRRQARRHYRVPERLPMTVADTAATCVDLTPAGLRAEVPAASAPPIGSTVRMELRLSEATPPIVLHGVVRSRSGGSETVRVGIELDADSRPDGLVAHYWLAPRDGLEAARPDEAGATGRHPMRARMRAGLRAATAGAGGIALVALAVPAAVAAGGLTTGTITQLSGSAACVADSGTDCPTARGVADMQDIAISHDGKSLYTTGFDGNIVGAFSIDQSTGALSQAAGTAGCIAETATDSCLDGKGLSGVRGIAISPDDRNVYIGAVNGDSVAVLDRDLASGTLSQSAGTDGCVSLSGSGGACATGRGLNGPGTPAVSPDGRNVYVPGDHSDAIAVFSRDGSSGDLSQLSGSDGCVSETGSGGCADGEGLLNPRSAVVSPDGKHVYSASQQGAVAAFARDASTGALTQLAGAAACVHDTGAGGCADGRALASARWVLVSPDGGHVYVVTTGGKSIATFARNPTTGALTQPAGTDGCIAASGSQGCLVAPHMNTGRGGTISPDGETLYGAFQGSDAVAVLRRAENGALAPLASPHGCVHNSGTAPCSDALAMGGPTDVAVSPDGGWVYVAGRTSDSMAAFKRELSPTCQPSTASTGSSTAVQLTLSCTDRHSDPLTHQLASSPSNGVVTAFDSSSGALTYQPGAGFSGVDTWTHRATDGVNPSTAASITITVAPPPAPQPAPGAGPAPAPNPGPGSGAPPTPPATPEPPGANAGFLPPGAAAIPRTLTGRYDAKRDAFLIRVRMKIRRRGLCARPCSAAAIISERVRRKARRGSGRSAAARTRDPWRTRARLGRARKLRLRGGRVERFEVAVRRPVIGARAKRKGAFLELPVRMIVTLKTRKGRARVRKDSRIRVSVRRYETAGALAARRALPRSGLGRSR